MIAGVLVVILGALFLGGIPLLSDYIERDEAQRRKPGFKTFRMDDAWADLKPDFGFPHYDDPTTFARKALRWRVLHYGYTPPPPKVVTPKGRLTFPKLRHEVNREYPGEVSVSFYR